jgi:hypothetical protein
MFIIKSICLRNKSVILKDFYLNVKELFYLAELTLMHAKRSRSKLLLKTINNYNVKESVIEIKLISHIITVVEMCHEHLRNIRSDFTDVLFHLHQKHSGCHLYFI